MASCPLGLLWGARTLPGGAVLVEQEHIRKVLLLRNPKTQCKKYPQALGPNVGIVYILGPLAFKTAPAESLKQGMHDMQATDDLCKLSKLSGCGVGPKP